MLLLALALRLYGVGFGLPALNDPDEPLFMMTALEMLRDHSLDPGWFGHPATILFYCLALISFLVGALGIASGRFADADAFVGAVYADPGILFLPARLLIVACGVACVFLTYRIGTRLGDKRLGLLAAFFLAINALHIEYSQIIRTDMLASVFMLLCTLCALAIFRDGRRRDYVLAGICVALACATKWPAAVILVSPICAGLVRLRHDRATPVNLALLGAVSVAALLLVSPFLVLDYPAVVRDLAGEARPVHPGATGFGLIGNLGWYAAHPLQHALGWAGLILAAAGLAAMARSAAARAAVLPGCLAFLVAISAQSLVWERWLVPLLPFTALGIAYALRTLGDRLGDRGRALQWALPTLLAAPMLVSTWTGARERLHDTRQTAAIWVREHVPADATILVEHAAFDLVDGPWRLLFPVGTAGCVDARHILRARVRYSQVETLRRGRPIVDIGNVESGKLGTCRAEFAVFSHYTRYASDAAFARQREKYLELMRDGVVRAIVRAEPGRSSGPDIVIVQRSRAGIAAPALPRRLPAMAPMHVRLAPSNHSPPGRGSRGRLHAGRGRTDDDFVDVHALGLLQRIADRPRDRVGR